MEYQIVADESVDHRIVIALRECGFAVYSISESQASVSDREVLGVAVTQGALLLTEDKDFGELVFRLQLSHKGILLLRLTEQTKSIKTLVQTIEKHYPALLNTFSVLSHDKLRIKDRY